MAIFIVRTTAGREKQVIDRIYSRVTREKEAVIKAVFSPHEVRGYFFIEADNRDEVLKAISHITHVKGIIQKEVTMKELEHFFESTAVQVNIQEKDIAEIISGPFKGEKAKIKRVDKIKEECVVELLEAAVPIPITVKIDSVRVIRREETDE